MTAKKENWREQKKMFQLLQIKILTFADNLLRGLVLRRIHAWDAGQLFSLYADGIITYAVDKCN